MKSTTGLVVILCVSALLAQCTKPKETAQAEADTVAAAGHENTEEAATPHADQVQLKGIYVTSTHIPAATYGYRSLFDGNAATYWATMPGSGSDEGIMLYFGEPQPVSHIEISQATGNNLAAIESVSIYVNGAAYKDADLASGKIELNSKDVQSLFIRIDKVASTTTQQSDAVTVFDFPSDKLIGIRELILYTNNTPVSVSLPAQVKGSMTASSTLQPEISYGIRNLFDSRKEFVWAEGAKSAGQNEVLTFSFPEEQEITGIKIMNGFQRSDKHYTANGRVKTLTVSTEKNQTGEISVNDQQGEQAIQLASPVTGKEIKLTIKDIYPGTTYKDLVISELGFINRSGSFILEDNITETIKQQLLEKVSSTALAKVLDKRIANELNEMDSYKRSLILRSDYTFVAYSEEGSESGSGSQTEEIIADGNWEIKELSADHVKIRIFGKLVRLSQSTDYYNGDSSESYLQIFQDNLTIDGQSITGEKFIRELKLPAHEN